MSFTNDASEGLAVPAGPVNPATETMPSADTSLAPLADTMGQLPPEALDGALESADPVAGSETAIQTVAEEFSRQADADGSSRSARTSREIETAIETLVNVALDADDPVAALEEGADALAEALAARDAAAEEWIEAAREQQADLQRAYRHARLHRVAELMDVGYGLDQAVAITNANEAEVRTLAVAAGRDPMNLIYRYAVLNGYQGAELSRPMPKALDHSAPGAPRGTRELPMMEALARLSDEAFAEATSGELWERLMRG